MMSMKQDADATPLAVVIGDVVSSRAAADRADLHERLADALASSNRDVRPVTPWRITVGDEFQGGFASVGAALHAVLLLRTALAGPPAADLGADRDGSGPVDVRFGVGWGRVATLAEEPRVEDGPGWWAAREAVEEVKRSARRAGLRHRRTAYRLARETTGPDPDLVNAALLCQDQVVGSVSPRSLRLLGGLLQGRPQADLAVAEGISASAVSQRVRHDGLAAVVAADELVRRVS
ncbi:SatD family protein [Nocardioides aurantiacus]|uniref:SatD family protein n=1 Tax=Nocardioides aurantiacus TaxID=86796 RepID=UPI00403FB1AC